MSSKSNGWKGEERRENDVAVIEEVDSIDPIQIQVMMKGLRAAPQ